ncbi:uncharacterized protein LOC129764384 isoform X2 [Toxorhynchites rutilus septentrionalis]|uniref:uncharacterized protein LOC129764384 isoform X2 n=1 Tax=Toxorhynchites rutilus septentrionalis TaxID=329112 RepID=UPI00247A10C7|nr:uncharacterized protein LOC129764384 isoform X2 [Toxorhynchites rutilus septentrionalis]
MVLDVKTALLVLLLLATIIELSTAETFECTVEEYGPEKHKYCVFRSVKYTKDTTDIVFKAPASKQPRVVFEDSELEHLPKDFLAKFGNDLKVLNVSSCKLRSVVITKAMEELYAIDNYIAKVIVHQTAQSSPMKEIYLQSNRLTDISNITRSCKNVRILDLSRNQELAQQSELNIAMFDGYTQLEYLLLADVGAFYLNYKKDPKLPSLTLLDLSMNNLIDSDLRLEYFNNFEKLAVLRLNDNSMSAIAYPQFTEMKSLKQVFLEGNTFECGYLKKMIQFLNEKGIETPVARSARNCGSGFNVESQMCCKSEYLQSVGIKDTKLPNEADSSAVATPSAITDTPTSHEVTTKRNDGVTTGAKSNGDSTPPNNGITLHSINIGVIICGLILMLMSIE